MDKQHVLYEVTYQRPNNLGRVVFSVVSAGGRQDAEAKADELAEAANDRIKNVQVPEGLNPPDTLAVWVKTERVGVVHLATA